MLIRMTLELVVECSESDAELYLNYEADAVEALATSQYSKIKVEKVSEASIIQSQIKADVTWCDGEVV